MRFEVECPDELYRQFKASLLLQNDDESEIILELIRGYVTKSLKISYESSLSTMLEEHNKEENKAIQRIPLWAQRPEQINHRIIQCYLVCSSDVICSKSAMKHFFVEAGYGSEWQFDSNFSSMCTNAGQAHGKVFETDGDTVELCNEVAATVNEYRESFLESKPLAASEIVECANTVADANMQKRRFVEWFRSLTYHGKPYNPVTISGYSGRIESACYDEVFDSISTKNLFQVTDIEEYIKIKKKIQSCSGYDSFDAKSHNGFTAALNKYQEFLMTEKNQIVIEEKERVGLNGMRTHNFSFAGGDILADMGASWFVSYAYYEKIDRNHKNWDKVSTSGMRASKYEKGRAYHQLWLREVLNMNPLNLNKNTIGLDAFQIKEMARKILENWK